jgi:diguanylate cyclase (GGDEF)-like protein
MPQQLLIIDDSKPIHALVKALLTDESINIHSATDPGYGLVLASSIRPDLVLLDVDMPGMSGFEACKRLKADRVTSGVPVIFLTALSSTEEKVRGLEMGAVDYVTKPFDPAELLARVRASLRTSQLIHLLEYKALIDPLTGLGNRAMFDKRNASEIALRIRFHNPLACIVLNLDNFKKINDRFGYPFGDQVLRKIANVISEMCRTEDIGCRYDADEFAIIAPHTTAADAAKLAERMRTAISKLAFVQQGESISTSCSFGIADAGDDFDRSMFQRASAAMEQSKQSGRNRVSIAPAQLAQQAVAA